jgi:uncharacterized protein
MRVRRCADAGEWLDGCGSLLLADEALHSRMLGLAGTLRDQPDAGADFLLVSAGAETVAAGLRTSPWPLQVSRGPAAAVRALARHLATRASDLAGVIGPVPSAEAFTRAWTAATGADARPGMASRSFACEQVRPPTGVAGALRGAEHADRDLLLAWLPAFQSEALPNDPALDFGPVVDRWIDASPAQGGFWLWEAGGQVTSLCGTTGATPNGIRILSVYTPPHLRGRGYASGLVAAVTQAELDRGRRLVFLSTDLSNPTSNRIYQAIGYRAVGDERSFRFEQS